MDKAAVVQATTGQYYIATFYPKGGGVFRWNDTKVSCIKLTVYCPQFAREGHLVLATGNCWFPNPPLTVIGSLVAKGLRQVI